jgi:hypothetical protein
MTQPDTIQITSSNSQTIEAVDLGEAVVLMQADETGEVQTVTLDHDQALQLAKVLQQMFGGR